jgi:hypothetical protein
VTPTRVLIATTQGPVEVQRITEEDPEVNSVVCLGGKAVALPISAAYNAFVRNPTGVIEKNFGHSAYRVDVSASIDDGFSWQLPLFLAHVFAAEDALVSASKNPSKTIFATGEVDRDLNILPVDHVPEKLEQFTRALSGGSLECTSLNIYLPTENTEKIDETWLTEIGLGSDICRVIPVTCILDIFSDLGFEGVLEGDEAEKRKEIVPLPQPVPYVKRGWALKLGIGVISGVALLGFGAFAVLGSVFSDWTGLVDSGKYGALEAELKKEGPETLKARWFYRYLQWSRVGEVSILILEKRPPQGQTCAAVRFGKVKAELHPAKQRPGNVFEPGSIQNLCGLDIRATSKNDAAYLWGRYERWGDNQRLNDENLVRSLTAGPRLEALHWSIDVPPRAYRGAVIRIVIAAANAPLDGTKEWMAEQLFQAKSDGDYERVARRMKRLGITLVTGRYKILR